MIKQNFKGKNTLLMGLGILGGGVNIAKWLLKQGANLTITDLKTKDELKESVDSLKRYKNVSFILGKHREKDFIRNEIIVFNQDILIDNPFLKIVETNNKQIENELTLFFKFSPTKNIIAVTGTRGKTTTVNWIAHLLQSKFKTTRALGNSPASSLIGMMGKLTKGEPVVIETPSCLLEQVWRVNFAPRIAVITNLYCDHLNRYKNIREYAKTKANIFSCQGRDGVLILNYNNQWTKFFLRQKPRAQVLFFSTKQLPAKMNGIFVKDKYKVYFKENQEEKFIFDAKNFVLEWGEHNLENLLPAILCAIKYQVLIKKVIKSIKSLSPIKFRQELVFRSKDLEIYNDTAATSPEATKLAVKKFANRGFDLILITGGTDRNLEFSNWAKEIKRYLTKEEIVFLKGSATQKMKKELKWRKVSEFTTLEGSVKAAFQKANKTKEKSIILFSPSSKSFEKFKNEFDRGEQFNKLIKKYI